MHDSRPGVERQLPSAGGEAQGLGCIFLILVGGLSGMVLPFLRRSIGHRYLGLRGFVGVVVFLFWGIAASRENFELYGCGALLWMIMTVSSVARPDDTLFGYPVHSFYNGWPRLARLFRCSEDTAKGVWELPVVLGTGVLVMQCVDQGLGIFILASGIATWLETAIVHDLQLRRLRQMRDAEIETEVLWDMYESRYGDRR